LLPPRAPRCLRYSCDVLTSTCSFQYPFVRSVLTLFDKVLARLPDGPLSVWAYDCVPQSIGLPSPPIRSSLASLTFSCHLLCFPHDSCGAWRPSQDRSASTALDTTRTSSTSMKHVPAHPRRSSLVCALYGMKKVVAG
jgi:hypothetical protein